MSTQVDNRVVSMQFDNQRFEKNVKQSMSTLDKLKQKLNLTGAAKGLENVNSAAQKVDMKGLASGVETVRAKFSALEVMGVTALANITNSAINAGKNIVKSLTITPVTTGFNEYELKMNATQTIMASTGESLETVNKHLEELNKYSDQTIYSFQDMTQNIGKFTNAGVKLEDAVLAMKGISNEAALSGANANEASRAMYNFAQALSVGYIQRIDWKSIELANMATVEFKEQLLDAAIAAGTVQKNADGMYSTIAHPDEAYTSAAMFTETLDDQWLTTEVLINTLKDYADETTDIGKRATKAATEVKTFSQMMDTLRESAQSGWARTWEIIFGDYNKGKTLWTSIAKVVGGILDKMSEIRNTFLGNLMSYNPLTDFMKKIESIGESVSNVSAAVQDYSEIVNKVIRGDFGNGQTRLEKLTEAGWEYAEVQNRVNEKLGSSVRLATKASQAQKEQTKTVTKLSDAKLKELGLTKDEIALYRDLEEQSEKTGKSINELIAEMESTDGRTLLLESFKNIGDALLGVFQALKDAWSEIFPAPTVVQIYNILDGFNKLTKALILNEETSDKLKRTFKGVFAIIDIIATFVGTVFKTAVRVVADVFGLFGGTILDTTATIGDMLVAFRDWVKEHNYIVIACNAIGDAIHWVVTNIRDMINAVKNSSFVQNIFGSISDAFTKVIDSFKNGIPHDIISGLANGIKNGAGTVVNAIIELGRKIIDGICDFFRIKSPSRVMMTIGGFIVSGLALGITSGSDRIMKSIKDLGKKIIDAFKGLDLSSISTLFYNVFRLFPNLKILNSLSALLNVFGVLGKNVIGGLINGISQAAPAVWETIKKVATSLIETFKKILGIHSPSRVMIAIGGFIIAGLALGLRDGASTIGDFFKDLAKNTISFVTDFANRVLDFIRNLDFGVVFAVAATTGLALLAKKCIDVAGKFADAAVGFSKLPKALGGFADALKEGLLFKKKNDFPTIAKGILQIAIAIGIMAGSIYILAKADVGKMWSAFGAVAALIVLVGGLVAALSLLNIKDGLKLGTVTMILIGISFSVMMFAKAISILGSMSADKLEQGFKVLGMLGLFVTALVAVTKIAGKNASAVGGTLIKMSIAILLLIFVAKQVSKLNEHEMTKGVGFLLVFTLFMKLLIKSTLGAGYNTKGLGASILKVALAILVLAFTARIIGGMDTKALAKGTAAMIVFAAIIAGLIHICKIGNDTTIAKVGGVIAAVGLAIFMMTISTAILGRMEPALLAKGIIAVGLFAAIIAGLIYAVKMAEGNGKGLGPTLLAVSIAIAILATTAMVLGLVDIAKLAKGIVAVGILVAMMSLLIYATRGASDCMKNLIVLTAAIVLLAGAIAVLSLIEPERLIASSGALSAVLAAFALLIKFSGSMGDVTSMIKPLGMMIAVVGLLGLVMWGISSLPTGEDILQKAAAIVMVMNAMSVALIAANRVSKGAKDIWKGILALTAMVVPLAAFTAALAFIPPVPGHIFTTLSYVLPVMLLMTALLVPLALIGKLGGWKAFIGILALTAMVVPLALFTAALAFMPAVPGHVSDTLDTLLPVMVLMIALLVPLTIIGLGMSSALIGMVALTAMVVPLWAFTKALESMPVIPSHVPEQVKLLIELMTSMTELLIPLTLIGILAPAALLGMGALSILMLLMVAFGELAIVVGAFMTWCPDLQTFLDTGIPVLEQLASGLGSIMGKFITGFSNEVMTILPTLGQSLSDFMTKAQGFIDGCKAIGTDTTVLNGAATMVAAILSLSAANVISQISQILSLGQSLPWLGIELSMFMTGAEDFIEGAKKITPEVASGIKALSEAILVLTAANMLNGISKWLSLGTSSIKTFGESLEPLGEGIGKFIAKVGVISTEHIDTAKNAADIIKVLADAATTLPNSGGWIGAIFGENDMGTWAEQLGTLADGITTFINKITEANITSDSVKIAGHAADIVVKLAEAAAEIPNTGGWLADLLGDNDFQKWSEQLPYVADGIVSFANKIAEANISEDSIKLAENAASIITALATAASNIPNTGGWLADLLGDNDFQKWSEQLPYVADGVAGFAEHLGEFSSTQLDSIRAAVDAISVIAQMSAEYGAIRDSGDFSSFGNGMITLAKKIKEFASKMSEITTKSIETAVKNIKSIIGVANTIADTDTSKCKSFGSDLASIAKNALDDFINAFGSEDAVSKVNSAGDTLIDNLIKALKGKQKDVNSAANGIAKEAAGKIVSYGKDDNKASFKSAGKDLIDGLINGLKDPVKLQQVYDAAFKLGQKAVEGEKDGQESNSPSKATTRAGKWLGEGLIIGMKSMMHAVYNSGNQLGENASNTISSAVSRIADAINSDIDAQPTIRPVLDLSDVQAGANSIAGMFSGNRTLAISAPGIGAISASMASRQNGNNELVSAINKLAKSNGKSGDTYQINGINYSEGSDVADAINTLVRAAKIEGRT